MSTFSYNGIDIDLIETMTLSQEAVYDPSGVDYLWTHFNFVIRGVLNAGLSDVPGEAPTTNMNRIRSKLETPRRTLIHTPAGIGGPLITSPKAGDSVDAKNGPIPRACKIIQLTEATFLIEYEVDTWIVECEDPTATPPPYLNNRYKTQVTIDDNFYTRRLITGRIHFRTNIQGNPDDFRDVFFPPLEPGFKRMNIDITVQEDQTAIDYSFTDQQVYTLPPPPATKLEGSHKISSCNFLATFNETVTVRVWGHRLTKKAQLLDIAAVVALNRAFPSTGAAGLKANKGKRCLKGCAIMDNIHENYIEVVLEIIASAGIDATIFGDLDDAQKAAKLDYILWQGRGNDFFQNVPDPGLRGTAGLKIAKVLMQQQCPTNSLRTIPLPRLRGGSVTSVTPATDEAQVTVRQTPKLPNIDPLYRSSDIDDGIYNDYYLETFYETNEHVLQMPVASSNLTTASFAYVANPTTIKRVVWKAEKIGGQPTMPTPETNNPNNILLTKTIRALAPYPTANGSTLVWRLAGEYIYGVVDPTFETINAGVMPFMDLSTLRTVIEEKHFLHGLIDSGTSTIHTLVSR